MLNLSMQTYRSLAPKDISPGHLGRFFLHNGRYSNALSRGSLSPIFAKTFTTTSQRQVSQKTRYWAYLCAGVFTGVCLQQTYAYSKKKTDSKDDESVKRWVDFNEKLQKQTNGKIPPPFEPVETLASKYLKEPGTILDIGCETGKNAACLIKKGHKVVLLDIASNAVSYTVENLKRENLDHGIQDSIVSKIEDLPAKYGPFKAVVGTYAFSFIPPHLFKQTMNEMVLKRVSENGYFAGGFFGEQHAWAVNKDLSILNVEELESLLSSQDFSILEIKEQIKEVPTVSDGITKFHTINVIAQKALKVP
ncbi:MAG: class I SAM-dependent methyltransferase [Simkania sp.]|nr:class I SAM-dependent methyltransferase [Simkania sp.]